MRAPRRLDVYDRLAERVINYVDWSAPESMYTALSSCVHVAFFPALEVMERKAIDMNAVIFGARVIVFSLRGGKS